MNVAAGGTNEYFPEGKCNKPWANTDPHAPNAFWNSMESTWGPTWNYPATNDAAMKIDHVKIWENVADDEPVFMQ
jgi:hypothetical protein